MDGQKKGKTEEETDTLFAGSPARISLPVSPTC